MHNQHNCDEYNDEYYARLVSNTAWWQRFGLVLNPEQGVVDAVRPRRGERILDLGCGDGRISWRLAEVGATVDAWDISKDGIALARLSHAAANLQFYVRDILTLDLADTYDAVLCWASLEHLRRDQVSVVLGRVGRSLKPGGRVVIGIPLHDTRPERRWLRKRVLRMTGDHTHLVEWSANSMLKEIRKAKLTPSTIRLATFGGLFLPAEVRYLSTLEKLVATWLTVQATKP